MPVSLQCGTIINSLEAILDHLAVADLDAGCSRVLPTIEPLPLDKIAVLMSLNRSSVPLSPIKIDPLFVLKKSRVFNFALLIISIIEEDAKLSLPWLSGIEAIKEERSTTDLRVRDPPAYSKKILFPE